MTSVGQSNFKWPGAQYGPTLLYPKLSIPFLEHIMSISIIYLILFISGQEAFKNLAVL